MSPGLNAVVPQQVATITAIPVEGGDVANTNAGSVRIAITGPEVPVAAFNATPSPASVLDVVTFDASTTSLAGVQCGASCSYSWDFGDGNTGSQLAVQHQYTNPGVFNVTLVATSASGPSGRITKPLVINPPAPPTAEFTFSPCVPAAVGCFRFSDASTVGLGATITSWVWDFGDSTSPATVAPVDHTFAASGNYNVKLTVTDSLGRVSKPVTHSVTVP
jgi:PKD repeat protein